MKIEIELKDAGGSFDIVTKCCQSEEEVDKSSLTELCVFTLLIRGIKNLTNQIHELSQNDPNKLLEMAKAEVMGNGKQ